jgi:group I intron endonuclease
VDCYKIYVVTNTVNGKKYVGQTVGSVARRWQQHLSTSRRRCKLSFHNSIRKHGEDAFQVEVAAFTFTKLHVDELESSLIRELQTCERSKGYNSTYGGEGARHTPETKAKLSNIRKGKPGAHWTDEQRKRHSEKQKGSKGNNWGKTASLEKKEKFSRQRIGSLNSMYGKRGKDHPKFGKRHSDEAKAKTSVKVSGVKNGMYGRVGSLSHSFGKALSEDTKQKLREAAWERAKTSPNNFAGKKHSEETKQKMRKPRSEETKRKMSEAAKRRVSKIIPVAFS